MSDAPVAPLLVVMGVAAAGKSVVGRALAEKLRVAYEDGDDLHSPEAIAKMASGVALDDEDRRPWLERVGAWLAAHDARGGVISCSALRRAYRAAMLASAPRAEFVHLVVDAGVLAKRIAARTHHFMPPSLLASQLATLEPLAPDEPGISLDATASTPDELASKLARWAVEPRRGANVGHVR